MTRPQEMKLIAEGSERNRLEVHSKLDAATARETALREELHFAKQLQTTTDAIVVMVDGQRDHWIEKCGRLKQRLSVAESRIANMESLVREVEPMVAMKHSSPWFHKRYAALKPEQEGE